MAGVCAEHLQPRTDDHSGQVASRFLPAHTSSHPKAGSLCVQVQSLVICPVAGPLHSFYHLSLQ